MQMISHVLPPWMLRQGYVGLAVATLLSSLIYAGCLIVYRLFMSPIAKFPGPRIAAATHYYEFYYNWWLQGQYIFKLEELHEKYGMRLNPISLTGFLNLCRTHHSNQS